MQREVWKKRAPGVVFGVLMIIWAVSEEPTLGGGPGFGLAQALVAAVGGLSIVLAFVWQKLVAGLISATVSLALALVLAELVIGAAFAPRYVAPFEYDPNLHYKLAPGAIREYQHAEINGADKFTYEVNEDGFRGPPLRPRSASVSRVVVYGDSFIQGEYSRYEDTFVFQLQESLAQHFERSFESINAGVAGYGPDQALRKMRAELDQLEPDLVIISVYSGNDFGDLVRNKLYRIDDATGTLVDNKFEVPASIVTSMQRSRTEPVIRKVLRDWAARWRGNTRQAESADQRIDRFLQQHESEYTQFVEHNNNVVGDLQEDPYTADISLDGSQPSAVYKARLMQAVLTAMHAELRARDIPGVLVIVPHPIDALGGDHDSGHVNLSAYPEYQPSRLSDWAASAGTQSGFSVVNLFPYFVANDPASLYFLGGDDHWNAKGQALAAARVAAFIRQEAILAVDPLSMPGG